MFSVVTTIIELPSLFSYFQFSSTNFIFSAFDLNTNPKMDMLFNIFNKIVTV